MREIIRFETNVPVTVTLKYPEGKEMDGRFGPQVMFTTDDDRLFFLNPPEASRLHALRLKAEPVTICKRAVQQGRKKSLFWEIEREQVSPKPVVATPAPAVPTAVATGDVSSSRPQGTITTRQLASVLIASIDALILARDYARSKGLESELVLDFNAEDARTLANATLIGIQKEVENVLRYGRTTAVEPKSNGNGYVNGGTSWPRQ